MAPQLPWLGVLKRLKCRAFQRSAGERIRILSRGSLTPDSAWRRPELRVIEQDQRVEYVLHVAGAKPDSIQVFWSEDDQTLSVCAPVDCSAQLPALAHPVTSGSVSWYTEIPVASDVDASRAKAFLQDGILRIVAPRFDSLPLTGCPLLVWTDAANSPALVAT